MHISMNFTSARTVNNKAVSVDRPMRFVFFQILWFCTNGWYISNED